LAFVDAVYRFGSAGYFGQFYIRGVKNASAAMRAVFAAATGMPCLASIILAALATIMMAD
jgi:hypothetical protein